MLAGKCGPLPSSARACCSILNANSIKGAPIFPLNRVATARQRSACARSSAESLVISHILPQVRDIRSSALAATRGCVPPVNKSALLPPPPAGGQLTRPIALSSPRDSGELAVYQARPTPKRQAAARAGPLKSRLFTRRRLNRLCAGLKIPPFRRFLEERTCVRGSLARALAGKLSRIGQLFF